jgi:hypothetical protein|tara:strand:+ start:334 stop:438 length:105 start_codon:yes stop_codon:yes gene_type:complete
VFVEQVFVERVFDLRFCWGGAVLDEKSNLSMKIL